MTAIINPKGQISKGAPVHFPLGSSVQSTEKQKSTSISTSPNPEPIKYYSEEEYKQLQQQLKHSDEQLALLQQQAKKDQAEHQATRAHAQEQGYQDGLEQAKEQSHTLIEGEITLLRQLFEQVEQQLNQQQQQYQQSLLTIIVAILERLLGPLTIKPKHIQHMIDQALKQAHIGEIKTIRLAPADYNNIQSYKEQLLHNLPTSNIKIISDPSIEYGGCMVDTDRETVDFCLDTQLSNLLKAIQHAHNQAQT